MSLEQNRQKSKYLNLPGVLQVLLVLIILGLIFANLAVWGEVWNHGQNHQIVLEEGFPLNFKDYLSVGEGGVEDWEVAASKNGKKYYFPRCSGLKRVKKENLIYFKTEDEALKVGLTLAKNCFK